MVAEIIESYVTATNVYENTGNQLRIGLINCHAHLYDSSGPVFPQKPGRVIWPGDIKVIYLTSMKSPLTYTVISGGMYHHLNAERNMESADVDSRIVRPYPSPDTNIGAAVADNLVTQS